jgi:hypothetical protein
MQLTLDEKSEKVVLREIELGHATDAAEVVARALELLEGESLLMSGHRQLIEEKLKKSFSEIERGEALSEDEALAFIEARKNRP